MQRDNEYRIEVQNALKDTVDDNDIEKVWHALSIMTQLPYGKPFFALLQDFGFSEDESIEIERKMPFGQSWEDFASDLRENPRPIDPNFVPNIPETVTEPIYNTTYYFEGYPKSDISPRSHEEHRQIVTEVGKDLDEQIQQELRELEVRVESGEPITLVGHQFKSLPELAFFADSLRSPNIEKFHVFYLKDDKIINHEVVTINNIGTTEGFEAEHLIKRAGELEADGIIDLHNHPSPTTGKYGRFSFEDISYYGRQQEAIGNLWKGGIVVASGAYGLATPIGDIGKIKFENRLPVTDINLHPIVDYVDRIYNLSDEDKIKIAEQREIPLHKRFGERENLGFDIESEEIILQYAKDLETRDNWSTLVFGHTHSNTIHAMVSYKNLHLLDPQDFASFIAMQTAEWGGTYSAVFFGKGDWYSSSADIKNFVGPAIAGEVGINAVWASGLEHQLFYSHEAQGIDPNQWQSTIEFGQR